MINHPWLYHGFTRFYDTLRARSFRGHGSPGLTHRFRTADLSHNRWRVVNCHMFVVSLSCGGYLERPIVLAYIPQLHWLISPFPVPLAAWWGVICPQKSRSQNLSSPSHPPTIHPSSTHQTPSNHPTDHTAARPQRFETTRGFDSNPGQTQPGCSPWCRAWNPMALWVKPYGFPFPWTRAFKAFKVSIRDMYHLGFLRPLHHCFGGLLEAGQLQLSLADSHLRRIQFNSGGDFFQQSDMSCLLNSVKPLSKICCTSIVQINIVHRGPNSTSHLNFVENFTHWFTNHLATYHLLI